MDFVDSKSGHLGQASSKSGHGVHGLANETPLNPMPSTRLGRVYYNTDADLINRCKELVMAGVVARNPISPELTLKSI